MTDASKSGDAEARPGKTPCRTDFNGHVLSGDVLALDSKDWLARSTSDTTVCAVGLELMIVVVTLDAAFAASIDSAQQVQREVEQLGVSGHKRTVEPAQVARPWGTYERVRASRPSRSS
ncbi:hypothetical protein H9L13_06500 [Sphingomonas lutea]|uniref:MannoseP isomerase/GMP-like beta-helix domain-containing protein n=1 Tax=Sphingomonas lutea TaxID=1045317 RepID=A0A7G9SEV8_9SPHN|nr:hypothetical protein [Sphingomonas lutea]QNN66383.1 hypothetical protein H9L13_06500 [Sphingomonas lutea]